MGLVPQQDTLENRGLYDFHYSYDFLKNVEIFLQQMKYT